MNTATETRKDRTEPNHRVTVFEVFVKGRQVT